MRASNMAEFWTRCGTLRGQATERLEVGGEKRWVSIWNYENGMASFDGKGWVFRLLPGVRK